MARYDHLVSAGALESDEQQRALLAKLQTLRMDLHMHSRQVAAYADALRIWHDAVEAHERRKQAQALAEAERRAQLPFWRRMLAEVLGIGAAAPNGHSRSAAGAATEPPVLRTMQIQPKPRDGDDAIDEGSAISVELRAARRKTLVMDIFADAVAADATQSAGASGSAAAAETLPLSSLPGGGIQVRRVHFNAFITECHKRLHSHSEAISRQLRQERSEASAAHAREGRPVCAGVLCFDEVQMMDIADATIVTGVLERLFEAGWVLCATCNRTPDEFANSILHVEHPQARFTSRVMERCSTVHLTQPVDPLTGVARDYRLNLRPSEEATFFAPLDHPATTEQLEASFARAVGGEEPSHTLAPIGAGRTIPILASSRGVARLSFSKLCGTPLGAADYIALAQRFHTLYLTGVPQLSLKSRDQARRFITLVDQLYNHRTKLVASAAVPLPLLFEGSVGAELDAYAGGALDQLEGLEFEGEAGKADELNPIGVTANSLKPGTAGAATARVSADSRKALLRDSLFTGEDEVFAFRRALSRLNEMQSEAYLAHGGERRIKNT